MAEFNVRFEEVGGEFGVDFRTEPGLPSQVSELNATANGTYDAGEDAAYNPVVVNVPNTYTPVDEGKVVSNSALIEQTSRTITQDGMYDTTLNNSVTIDYSGDIVHLTFEATSSNQYMSLFFPRKTSVPKKIIVTTTTIGEAISDYVNGETISILINPINPEELSVKNHVVGGANYRNMASGRESCIYQMQFPQTGLSNYSGCVFEITQDGVSVIIYRPDSNAYFPIGIIYDVIAVWP